MIAGELSVWNVPSMTVVIARIIVGNAYITCRNMRSLFRFKYLLLLCGLLLTFTACDDDEVCEDVTANELRIGFYLEGQEEEVWGGVDSLSVYALEKPDQPIYETEHSVTLIELPLNPSADSCGFVLDFFHERDTILLHYERETTFLSVDCGFTTFFDLADITHTTNYIVSLAESNTYVTNTFDEHLEVFLPDTGDTD